MKTVAIIQARMTSTRLPGKILLDLGGKPVLQNIVERIQKSKLIDTVIVATSVNKEDDVVERFLKTNNINVYRGSLDNVLARFYGCAKLYNADTVLRFTADNALIAPELIDEAIMLFNDKAVDYLYYKPTLPLGMGIEIFSFLALEKAYQNATDAECLEHVTPYIKKNPQLFNILTWLDDKEVDRSALRFTMDTQQDYEFVSIIYNNFQTNDFTYKDVLQALAIHPEWKIINQFVEQKTISYHGEKRP